LGKDTIIILNNGLRVSFTPIAVKFIDELEQFFDERDIPIKNIPAYLFALSKRELEKTTKTD